MEAEAAKYIGAGLAMLGMMGAGSGLGILFGNYLSAAIRNPSAAAGERPMLFLGMALTEALGIFALVIAFLILFAEPKWRAICDVGGSGRKHGPLCPRDPRGNRSRRAC